MLQNAVNLICFFSLHIECIKVAFSAVTRFGGSYYVQVKNFMADVVFQGVTAFESVRNNIFMACLSHCYFCVTVSAKALSTVLTYFGAIGF